MMVNMVVHSEREAGNYEAGGDVWQTRSVLQVAPHQAANYAISAQMST